MNLLTKNHVPERYKRIPHHLHRSSDNDIGKEEKINERKIARDDHSLDQV